MLIIKEGDTEVARYDGESFKTADDVDPLIAKIFKEVADSKEIRPQHGEHQAHVASAFKRAGYDVEFIPEAEVQEGADY